MAARVVRASLILVMCSLLSTSGAAGGPTITASPGTPAGDSVFLDRLAQDTWAYLGSDWTTANHLPWSWRSATITGGDYANPAEIGLYALSWLAAYDLGRPWSPTWPETEAELSTVLEQLRAWQTGSQPEQPHGPNAFQSRVFYQWYWISWDPPVVGAGAVDHAVPSIDNAWLAASLITLRAYAQANGHPVLAQQAGNILADMDLTLWYHPEAHRFSWGTTDNPQGGGLADYYSNENRIINFVARALGQLDTEEFLLSLAALEAPSGGYEGITVDRLNWDGSYFAYTAPALFVREWATAYGAHTIVPATQAQIAYAQDRGYDAWGFSDCFDVGNGPYVQQGAPPAALGGPTETRPGLVAPHAGALALITPLAPEAISNLQTISNTFGCAYEPPYGFRDSLMANPAAGDHRECSSRFSALAQEWTFLAIVNHQTGFVWDYFYRDSGVVSAHMDMFGSHRTVVPMVVR